MESLGGTDPVSVGGYPLFARLGAGGMGQVYLARTRAGRPLALKTVRSEFGLDPAFGERFAREIRHADRVRSPWTVTVIDFSPADARPQWLATEYVAAPSLADWVGGHGPLPEASLTALAAELCEALHAVHQTGLAHRDVKPSNVLLAGQRPLLIDFGIARAAEDSRHTRTGAMIGSPGYMPPEQATEGVSAEPGDVFALGAVLVHAATGRGPFHRPGENPPASALLYRVVHEEPDLAGVPEGLLPLVRACLAKQPGDRPTARAAAGLLAEPDRPAGLWARRLPAGLPAELASREATMRAALGEPAVEPPTRPATVVDRTPPPSGSAGPAVAVPPGPSPDSVTRTAHDRPPGRNGPVPAPVQGPAEEDDEGEHGRGAAPRPSRTTGHRAWLVVAAGVVAVAAVAGVLVYSLGDSGSDDDGKTGGSAGSTTAGAGGQSADPHALPAAWVGTWAATGPGNPGNYSMALQTDSYKITLTLRAGRLGELVGQQVSDIHDLDTGKNDGCTETLELRSMNAGVVHFVARTARRTDPAGTVSCPVGNSYDLSMTDGTLELAPASPRFGAPTELTRQ
ncbi:protein kinase domain-containing protein [Streptomyces sp. NBC_01198]|uniref:protein kinase domain-containing protein n=1 Tax=Streptomyces sp. NBC_01198 TaxID=2903769 RepID=UPI002E15E341|nr:protein kinase [Streptomyces sp. NBC_01198]